MAKDFIPAVIKNNTTNAYMVILNGDLKPGQETDEKSFAIIAPGESSDVRFRSIDALAVYSIKDNQSIMVQGANGKSHWWKVPNGNHGSIKPNENGTITLDTSFDIPTSYHIPYKDPAPSKASTWDFKPEYLNELLKESGINSPAAKTPEPTSKLESNQSVKPAPQTETLIGYLTRNHSSEDSVRILQAMQAQTTELDRAV